MKARVKQVGAEGNEDGAQRQTREGVFPLGSGVRSKLGWTNKTGMKHRTVWENERQNITGNTEADMCNETVWHRVRTLGLGTSEMKLRSLECKNKTDLSQKQF